MTGDAATTVSAVSRCLTGALAAKPHSPAAPSLALVAPSPHTAAAGPIGALTEVHHCRAPCVRPPSQTHWVLAAGPRCRGFLIRVLTPDPSRVRIGERGEDRVEARREVRIAGETAADKVGDTGMLGDAAGAPTCTEGRRRRDRDGGSTERWRRRRGRDDVTRRLGDDVVATTRRRRRARLQSRCRLIRVAFTAPAAPSLTFPFSPSLHPRGHPRCHSPHIPSLTPSLQLSHCILTPARCPHPYQQAPPLLRTKMSV